MPRKPKSHQDPTPINKKTLGDKIEKMAGGSNGDVPPESPADMALADQLWGELEDEDHEVEVSRIPANYLTELRRRVRDGELPTSMLTGDDATAADNWTRTEIGRLFIRFRRRVGKYKIREFIPVIHDQPTDRREWVRGSERLDAAIKHAAASLTQSVDTGIKLHGAALVALGVADWHDIEDYTVKRVRQQCAMGRGTQDLRIAK
jgi:hypothetical protein